MTGLLLIALVALLAVSAYGLGKAKAKAIAAAGNPMRSRPSHHGLLVALWCGVPSGALALAGLAFNFVPGAAGSAALFVAVLSLAVAGLAYSRSRIRAAGKARVQLETALRFLLAGASAVAILTTIGIVLSMVFESIRFFSMVPFHEFLFGLEWSPQIALRDDQVGSTGLFGAVPVFAGTVLISLIAMAVAAPVGLMSAIWMAEYAPEGVRAVVKPLLEILAGIPTVVYGFFAALTVAPWVRDLGSALGLQASSESALAAGAVMGIMILPFISSLSDEVGNRAPGDLAGCSPGGGRRFVAGGVPGDRRDHDRCHGRWLGRQAHRQSVGGGDDSDRANGDLAHR